MKFLRASVLILLALFVTSADARMKGGAVGSRKAQIGLQGWNYFAGFSPLLNWWKISGGISVNLSAGGSITGAPVYNKGYAQASGEFADPVPTAVASYVNLFYAQILQPYSPTVNYLAGGAYTPTSILTIDWLGTGTVDMTSMGGTADHTCDTSGTDAPTGRTYCTFHLGTGTGSAPRATFTPTGPLNGSSQRTDTPRSVRIYKTKFKANIDRGEVYDPEWLALIAQWGRVRFMDPLITNVSQLTNYSQFVQPIDALWARTVVAPGINGEAGVRGSIPLATISELANKTGQQVHVNIPSMCTDACVTSIAQFFKDNVPSTGPKVLFEYTNENWNQGFSGAGAGILNNPCNTQLNPYNVATGSISGTTLTITDSGSQGFGPNLCIVGTGIATNTYIVQQLSGTTGDVGTYQISRSQSVASTASIYVYQSIVGQYAYSTAMGVAQPASLATPKTIASVTSGNPTTITTTGSHGFANFFVSLLVDDPIYGPLLNLKSQLYTVTGANTLTVPIDTTGLGTFTSTTSTISDRNSRGSIYYGYRAAQIMGIVRGVYGTDSGTRWVGGLGSQTADNAQVSIDALSGVNAYITQVGGSLTVAKLFSEVMVTSYVASEGDFTNVYYVTGITKQAVTANTPVVTTNGSNNYVVGQAVKLFADTGGMTQLNNTYATITSIIDSSNFSININTSTYGTPNGSERVSNGSPFQLMDQSLVNSSLDPVRYPTKYTYYNQTVSNAAIYGYTTFTRSSLVYPFTAATSEQVGMSLSVAQLKGKAKATTGTGVITAGVLNATAVASGTIAVGDILRFDGITAYVVVSQLTGTAGGVGTYQLGYNDIWLVNRASGSFFVDTGPWESQKTVATANGLSLSQYEGSWNWKGSFWLYGNPSAFPQYSEYQLQLYASWEVGQVISAAWHYFETDFSGIFNSQFLETGGAQPGSPWTPTRNFPGDIGGRWSVETGFSRGIN